MDYRSAIIKRLLDTYEADLRALGDKIIDLKDAKLTKIDFTIEPKVEKPNDN